MSDSANQNLLEAIARSTGAPLQLVTTRYNEVLAVMSRDARVQSFIPLLAARANVS